jgi:hypothetical protein
MMKDADQEDRKLEKYIQEWYYGEEMPQFARALGRSTT